MFKTKLWLILAILTVAIMSFACGPGPETTEDGAEPGGNLPPEISSLTAAQTQVHPSSIIEMRCTASDPNGDEITYTWSATGGDFSGAGPVLSWVAPEHLGSYDVTVTVRDDEGGVARKTITLDVVRNRDPEIFGLDAVPPEVEPEDESVITCSARDPDGDALNYDWKASDGSITGVGDSVTWVAPDREGEFTIIVTVDDGKGGQNAADVLVTVALIEKTVTLSLLPDETGTVSSTGDKDTSKIVAGDNDKDIGYRAFFSFDISQLKGTTIKDATLTLGEANIVGEPFAKVVGLGGLRLWQVSGEPGKLPGYNTERHLLAEAREIMWEPPTVIDVTTEVRNRVVTPKVSIHLQFEARFLNKTNLDHMDDYVRWSTATLEVTYKKK